MPNGFIGRPAVAYLTRASDAHSTAARTTAQTSSEATAQNPDARGMARTASPRRLPFSPEDGKTGGFSTGRGNSSNIVVDRHVCEEIARKITHADDKAGESLYRIAMEVENMCNTTFVMPTASPRCLNVAMATKTFLEEYRKLTDEIAASMRKFAQETTDIG